MLREGDRVLQQRNDYTKEVFNGDLGTIVAVGGNGSVRVVFGNQSSSVDEKDGDGEKLGKSSSSKTEKTNTIDPIQRALDSLAHGAREVQYKKSELRDLIPAWALTVHKAQGSEYRAVVLCLAAHTGRCYDASWCTPPFHEPRRRSSCWRRPLRYPPR